MLLREATRLQALVVVFRYDVSSAGLAKTNMWLSLSTYPMHDPRFVITVGRDYVRDFVRGAWGAADVWVRVDDFIRRRRQGAIPSECILHITRELSIPQRACCASRTPPMENRNVSNIIPSSPCAL
jgi:hypothetical protein